VDVALNISVDKRIYLLIIIVLAIIVEVFFLNKAVSTDGIFYIYTARQIQKNPLRPYDFEMNDNGSQRPASVIANNPPFFSYYLALGEFIFKKVWPKISEEKMWHLLLLVWTVLAVVGFWLLSQFYLRSFSGRLLATALWFFSPAFLVNSQNIMYDVGLLTFLLWALYFYQLAIRQNFFIYKVVGIILGLLAGYLKFYGLLIFGCFLFLEEKKAIRWLLVVILLFFILFSEVFWRGLAGYSFLLAAGRVGIGTKISVEKFWAFINYLGGAVIFPLGFWLLVERRWLMVVGGLLLVGAGLFFVRVFDFFTGLHLAVFLASFFGLFFWFISHGPQSIEEQFLHFWFGIFLLFILLVSSIIAVRYLLPAIVPLILLVSRQLERYSWQKYILGLLSVILGIAVAVADYQYANVYPRMVLDIKKYWASESPIYFCGHYGFQYYLEKENARAVLTEDNSRLGLVALARFADPQRIYPGLRQELVLRKFYPATWPVFTQNSFLAAGFHLNLFGVLPYRIDWKMPLEILDIRRVY